MEVFLMNKYLILLFLLGVILILVACANSEGKVLGEYDTSKLLGDII